MAVMDAGVSCPLRGYKLADVRAAGLANSLLRLPTNFTARRNQPAPHCGKGHKPVYGLKVRPLARTYKGKAIAATPPDRVETWTEEGVATRRVPEAGMRAEVWEDLVLPGVVPGPQVPTLWEQADTFRVYAIYDPTYTTPWLLATPLKYPRSGHKLKPATVKAMYQDRWPVEQIPLSYPQSGHSAKQRIALTASSCMPMRASNACQSWPCWPDRS